MTTGGDTRTYAISLDLAEGQMIFEALAELPFKQVYVLIGRLNRQANELAAEAGDRGVDSSARQVYRLDAAEFALLLRALGELPFTRVHSLLASLNAQTRAQADPSSGFAAAVAND